MPRPGGEADKLGNRYEGLWVVDAILDLLEGESTELTYEPLGEEADGMEFSLTTISGTKQYHTIKRQRAKGPWTLSALAASSGSTQRSVLGDLIAKAGTGAEAVFSSGTSASELEDLTCWARKSDSLETFKLWLVGNPRLSGRFQECIVKLCGDEETAFHRSRLLSVRTENESTLRKNIERRIRGMFRAGSGNPLDAVVVLLHLADFALAHLGTTITAEKVQSFLESIDTLPVLLTGNINVKSSIDQWNNRYLNAGKWFLINGKPIPRSEATEAYAALLDQEKSGMIEGKAGGGKSTVLLQVLSKLQDAGVPFLVLRLDQLTADDTTAQRIGMRRNLPASPVITLGGYAGENPSVLCIDQVDAIGLVSARNQPAWYAVTELLEEANTFPNMRILFACRSFDLEHDPQLRVLASDTNRIERINVGDLDEESIRSAILESGANVGPLSPSQMGILAVPLHLYLFLAANPTGAVEFNGKGDLFEAFWKHKAQTVDSKSPTQSSLWTDAIAVLCQSMSKNQSLLAPEYVLDGFSIARDLLASESVISNQDGDLQFFHEAFFDYAFAREFVRQQNDLVQWLLVDEQNLFRRSQVRQILTFLREWDSTWPLYLKTLDDLLASPDVRFHIKKLVLDWLRSQPEPTYEEWQKVEGQKGQLADYIWGVVHDSVAWFDLLIAQGKWQDWLAADDATANMAFSRLYGPSLLPARSKDVAELISRYRGKSEQWDSRLRLLVRAQSNFSSTEMQDLAIELIRDGTLDVATPGFATNDDWWSIWYSTCSEKPDFVARVLGAWIDRQVQIPLEQGQPSPFGEGSLRIPYSQFSKHVITECTTRVPLDFVRELFPRFLKLDKETPKQQVVAPNVGGNPEQQLRHGLHLAMTRLAKDEPSVLDAIVAEEVLSDSPWMSALVLLTWSANPAHYAERIVDYLLEDPQARLVLGYSFGLGGSDILAAVGRTAVSSASPVCSDESFAALEDAILQLTPGWEVAAGCEGRTRLAVLRALDQQRLSDAAKQHIDALEIQFPDAPEHGAPLPLPDNPVQTVGPPISPAEQASMNDEEWLSTMANYSHTEATFENGKLVGGAFELSRALKNAVCLSPERFAALVSKMKSTHVPVYFEAILEGLTESAAKNEKLSTFDQVVDVLRTIRDLPVSVSGQSIARAIGCIADDAVPDDIVDMLCSVATEDSDPATDLWYMYDGDSQIAPITQAINSARGVAADALAKLLFADRGRWARLKPTVASVVQDHVHAVRSVAVECLLAVLDTNRNDSLELFEKLQAGAANILGTSCVERYLHFAVFREYSAIRPILLQMLDSTNAHTAEVAARQVTLASLWLEEANGDQELVLAKSELTRMGAAEVFANNIANETVGAVCEGYLNLLFQDSSGLVRQAAADCWRVLEPDQVAKYGSLIRSYAQSLQSGDRFNLLLNRLNEARVALPAEVCGIGEQILGACEADVADGKPPDIGYGFDLAPLIVRLYQETENSDVRRRALNLIDSMARIGFFGVDTQLHELDR